MATINPTTLNPEDPLGSRFEQLASKDKQIGYGLLGLAALLLAIPIGVSYAYGSSGVLVSVWGGVLALLALVAGLSVLAPVPDSLTAGERLRMALLTLGGSSGFFTALLGLVLPFSASFQPVFTGGLLEWRKNPGTLLTVGLALLGGLLLMFLSLQLAHGLERTRAVLRRILYGYNTILSCLLLLIILGFLNILSYVTLWPFDVMGKTIDWTRNKQYTLNDGFRKLLTSLDKPVHVYALIGGGGGDILTEEIDSLLKNVKNTAPRYIQSDILSRDFNSRRVFELQKKYNFPEPEGLLVVYGDEEEKPLNDFVGIRELVDNEGRRFTGENALYKSIDYLTQGKNKPTIYFTQGNGELSFSRGQRGKPSDSMASLIERLNLGNYTPRELRYDPKESTDVLTKRLLEECETIVIARPTQPLPPPLIASLRDFVKGNDKKHGKLFLLFDALTNQDGKVVQTGLEPLLAENRLRLGEDRIINPLYQQLSLPSPLQFIALLDPRSDDNPIVRGLSAGTGVQMQFRFDNARSLELSPANPQGPPQATQVDSLIVIPQQFGFCWASKDLTSDPQQLAMERQRNRKELLSVVQSAPLSIAAAVTQSKSPPMPNIPGMPPHPPTGQQPVMLVFSNASWISDQFLGERSPDRSTQNWTLFANSLTWLHERPDTGVKADPREPDYFPRIKDSISYFNLVIPPGLLILVAILGLGVGVWMVRRR